MRVSGPARTLILAALLVGPGTRLPRALAHAGAPYPILVDGEGPGFLVSVWADPDVGTGTYYIMIDPPRYSDSPPPVPEIEVRVQPATGRLEPVTWKAERQTEYDRIQFVARPEFDSQETWTSWIVVRPPGIEPIEFRIDVEVTPPGLGPVFMLIYLTPFLLFGGLWGRVLWLKWYPREERGPVDTDSRREGIVKKRGESDDLRT